MSKNDIRAKGFARRSTVQQALNWIDDQSIQRQTEPVALEHGAGRVVAQKIDSEFDVPAFRKSMMDGYAVRANEIQGATPYNQLPLDISGKIHAGDHSIELAEGKSCEIMTGAQVPKGADAVLPFEDAQSEASGVFAISSVPAGKNIARIGEDISIGQTLVEVGRMLRPQDLGVLSSVGISKLSVFSKVKVRILVTGNEILKAGSTPQLGKTIDSNSPMLSALVERDGGIATVEMIDDEESEIEKSLKGEADIFLISGGSSVGRRDLAPSVIRKLGELSHHGIAMRPSSPAGMGKIGNAFVFLLPGNPVSCLCAYDFFAGRMIRKVAGLATDMPYQKIELPLALKIVSKIGRIDYCRVRILKNQTVEPIAISGASILSSTTIADGFMIIPQDSEGFPEGNVVEVYRY